MKNGRFTLLTITICQFFWSDWTGNLTDTHLSISIFQDPWRILESRTRCTALSCVTDWNQILGTAAFDLGRTIVAPCHYNFNSGTSGMGKMPCKRSKTTSALWLASNFRNLPMWSNVTWNVKSTITTKNSKRLFHVLQPAQSAQQDLQSLNSLVM